MLGVGRLAHRREDALVAGAPAERSRQRDADLVVGRVRVVAEERGHRHDEARRAEAALQAVAVAERRLHRGELAVGRGDSFDRRHLGAVGLDGEHETRAHRRAVEEHRARAAHAVLASEVRPGEAAQSSRRKSARVGAARRSRRATRPFTVTWSRDVSASSASAQARVHARRHHRRAHSAFGTPPSRCRSEGTDSRPAIARRPTSSASTSATSRPATAASAAVGRSGVDPRPISPIGAAPDPVVGVELDADRGAGDREVAVPARELLDREAAPAAPDREASRPRGARRAACSWSRSPRRSRVRGCCRRPLADTTSMLASSASATAGYSPAGSACAIDPPSVPRLRIWKWPMNGVRAPRAAAPPPRPVGAARSTSARVRAPRRSTSASSRTLDALQLGAMRPTSTRCSKTARPQRRASGRGSAAGEHLRLVAELGERASTASAPSPGGVVLERRGLHGPPPLSAHGSEEASAGRRRRARAAPSRRSDRRAACRPSASRCSAARPTSAGSAAPPSG